MALRRVSRSATVLICAAVVTCASLVAAVADDPPPGQVLSNFENHYGANIVRDCGYSQPLPADPGSSLWLFCDTDVYRFNAQGQWTLSDIIGGSTAAEGPAVRGRVPTRLSELTTPDSGVPPIPNHDGPAQFLPTPSGLVTSGGLPCESADNSYAASWITGVTRDAARPSDVLISFNNYCVQSGGSFLAEGFGLARYAPATNTRSSQVTVFTSPPGAALTQQERLGSPIFSGHYLYLFASRCNETYDATCIANSGNAVYLARVSAKPSAWDNSRNYRWYAGPSSWTANPGSAVSVVSGARPLSVTVNNFSALGHGLVLIEQTNIVGGFTVYQASHPSGAWQEKTSGTVPCTIEGDSFCRAIIGHPELSTRRHLLVSFFNPGAAPHYNPSADAEGHVMVAAFPW
jgi:hypothetical protein